jgi:hypothetical protein
MKKGSFICISKCAIILLSAGLPGLANAASEKADSALIEQSWAQPAEVICQPAADPDTPLETIVLERGQEPQEVCAGARFRTLVFYPEIIAGEPPPDEGEAPPSE